jgi:hypothetical protein
MRIINDRQEELDVQKVMIEKMSETIEELQKSVEDLINRNYLLECKAAQLEFELVEEVMKNKIA